jgi:hypothetical protein
MEDLSVIQVVSLAFVIKESKRRRQKKIKRIHSGFGQTTI